MDIEPLAVNDELPVPFFQRGLDDLRIALRPIIAAARDKPDAVAVALNAEREGVGLDLAEPFRAGGNLGPGG
jgi:hypothetical protein